MPNIHSRYALDTVSKLSKRPRMVQTPRFKDTTKYDNTVHIHSIPMTIPAQIAPNLTTGAEHAMNSDWALHSASALAVFQHRGDFSKDVESVRHEEVV
ncbi:hypothetical protein VTN49DRAFT_2145 [Thermomyces lanuginosus]|uniref:uncharacterized protein n=1 Tax=Thermomyces lanuginosus TaxID=5541 RepID=UPI003743D5D2